MRPLIGVCVLALLACGSPSSSGLVPSPSRISITEAYRVVLAPDGTLIVPAGHSNRVLRFNPSTQVVTVVAGDGGSTFRGTASDAASRSIGLPRDAAVQTDGAIVIALDSARVARVDAGTRRLTVIAGTGETGFRGDGGPATAAWLDDPIAIAVDARGDVYVAEAGNRIRRIDPSGVISTIAGTGIAGFAGDGGPATRARLNQPHGLVAGADGTIYVADTGNNRVRKIDSRGIMTTLETGPLSTPTGVAISPDGAVLVADFMNGRVRRVRGGTSDTLLDSVPGVDGMVVLPDGTLYLSVLDTGLLKVTTDGNRVPVGR